jgi:AcrR family transcriptional regulator
MVKDRTQPKKEQQITSDNPHRQLKERLRQERAELILDVVEEALAEKGYHELSMDEVAARAGVAKGTLYQHFASKDDLIFALFERNLAALEQTVARVAATPDSPRAKLEAILRWVYLEQSGAHNQLFQTLYSNEDMRRRLFEKKAQVRERSDQFIGQIRAVIDAGKAAGEFNANISTALIITSFLHWLSRGRYSYAQISQGENLSSEQLLAQVEQFFFDGIVIKQQGPDAHE